MDMDNVKGTDVDVRKQPVLIEHALVRGICGKLSSMFRIGMTEQNILRSTGPVSQFLVLVSYAHPVLACLIIPIMEMITSQSVL